MPYLIYTISFAGLSLIVFALNVLLAQNGGSAIPGTSSAIIPVLGAAILSGSRFVMKNGVMPGKGKSFQFSLTATIIVLTVSAGLAAAMNTLDSGIFDDVRETLEQAGGQENIAVALGLVSLLLIVINYLFFRLGARSVAKSLASKAKSQPGGLYTQRKPAPVSPQEPTYFARQNNPEPGQSVSSAWSSQAGSQVVRRRLMSQYIYYVVLFAALDLMQTYLWRSQPVSEAFMTLMLAATVGLAAMFAGWHFTRVNWRQARRAEVMAFMVISAVLTILAHSLVMWVTHDFSVDLATGSIMFKGQAYMPAELPSSLAPIAGIIALINGVTYPIGTWLRALTLRDNG